ncbi:MAG: hypothetical protein AB7H48_06250 [Parachlamydiales bacterium]
MSLIRSCGGVEGGNWVAQVFQDVIGKSLSETVSSLFSSIHKNFIEPLYQAFQQCTTSLKDDRSIDSTSPGPIVKKSTVERGISGTPASRDKPQVSYKLSSPEEYKEKLIALHNKYKEQETGYNDTYEINNCGHDHGRNEEHYAYLLDPYKKAMAQLWGQIKGYTEQFKSDFPNESDVFQEELLTTNHQEEARRESYTDYSIYESGKNTKTQVQVNKEDVLSDIEWW